MNDWRVLEHAHTQRVQALTSAHVARRGRHERHPVEDFLWTYFSVKPGELKRWHPGAGIVLEGDDPQRLSWRYYTAAAHKNFSQSGISLDLPIFFAKRGTTVDYVEHLLEETMTHTPKFNCFGLHEWAMVYRTSADQIRHTGLPLRLGHQASDLVVESNTIRCTHFDAYRFFTPAAIPLNSIELSRDTQPEHEQAGCLHAGMDIYKWVTKLGPIIPGELLLDAFEFARDIREVDMQASPYDVSAYIGASGSPLQAIPIETPEGKQQYAKAQKGFLIRGNALRVRVLDSIRIARAHYSSVQLASA